MRFLKACILGLVLMTGFLVFSPAPPTFAAGDSSSQACEALKAVSPDKSCDTKDAAGKKINKVIATAVNILSIVAGVIAVIMIIIGGFKYITSDGDSGNISSAKKTIIYAIVGLIVVVLAQAIVKFVLNEAK